jgi:cytochrome c553
MPRLVRCRAGRVRVRLSDVRWRRWVKYGAALLLFATVAGGIFVWSGVYNVAASSDHWAITTWILERVRVQSVDTWSAFAAEPPPLDDADMIKLGAAHFEGGCTPCHSRPDDPANAIAASMLPPPPPLAPAVADKETKEIFWIVKHGLKFTAMPAWSSQERDDEVWALTAFLEQLPGISQQEYRELSGAARVGGEWRSSGQLAESSEPVALTQCVRCHGDAAMPPLSDLVPRLNGQPQAYLERALSEYAKASRPSGIMQPVADLLEEDEARRIAAWYAGLDPAPTRRSSEPEQAERGRQLALGGDPERGIPPCLACHSEQHQNDFPSLKGQNGPYLESQLRVFRTGGRDSTVYGQVMAVVARRLTPAQVEQAAEYFASLPPGDEGLIGEPAP